MIEKTIQRLIGNKEAKGINKEDIQVVEQLLGITLPDSFRYMYEKVGKDPLFMNSFCHFYSIEDLIFKGNKIQFLEENQDVCRWAFDIEDINNPKVYQQVDEEEWYLLEKTPLDKFLSDILYYQCAMGYEFASEILLERSLLFSILDSGWEKVVSFDGLYIYWKQDTLIWYLADDNMLGEVYYATPKEEIFINDRHLFCLK